MLFTQQAEQHCTPCMCYYYTVNSQLHQLYIMKNHRPTVHVFLLDCKPQPHQLYCAMEVVQQGVIQIFTFYDTAV